MSRKTADIICRALLAIVAVIREENNLPMYNNITIEIKDSITGAAEYKEPTLTESPTT